MRTRLSCLAIVLIPIAVYASALWTEFGTPADFVLLDAGTGARAGALQTADGILNGALLEISYGFVHGVAELAYLRGLSLLLLVLCGFALWQLLERAGWSDIDAAAAAVCVLLLPTAQIAVGWASAWPSMLAALLSLAGFAAVESELEIGGGRRFVAVLGGALLYGAAAMCYFPGALMGLVALTGVGLARLPRQWPETRKWFYSHVAVLVGGLAVALAIERAMWHGAGVVDASSWPQRIVELVTFALPLAWAPFVAAGSWSARLLCSAAGLAALVAMFVLGRRLARVDERVAGLWQLILPGVVALYGVVMVLIPGGAANYRALWPMAGVAVVALLAAVRVLTTQPGGRPIWHHGVVGAAVVVGAVVAFSQVQTAIVSPLSSEWRVVQEAVRRASVGSGAHFEVIIGRDADHSPMPTGGFGESLTTHKPGARGAVEAAIRERFPTGLPKGVRFEITTNTRGSGAPQGAAVIDLMAMRR